MSTYSLSHLGDEALLRNLRAVIARDRATTAELLAHLAEVDARKLYLPVAYPSMYAYCVRELHLSEDAAAKRIQAARTARRFPAIFDALARGRLHLSAVGLLAPYLTPENADELLAAATHRTKAEIEQLLAQRFPRPDVLAWVQETSHSTPALPPQQHAPGHVEDGLSPVTDTAQPAPERRSNRPTVKPLSSQSFAVQFTLSQSAHDKLRYAQALLGHQLPMGDIAQIFERALDALIPQLEKRKFAATARPRSGRRWSTSGSRHIPAHVKRTVWERDGGRCTFVSEAGRRCPARSRLEFDHIEEVARGGLATVGGIRLRCKAHNQYAAECTFGVGFMSRKREEAQSARVRAQAARPVTQLAPGRVPSPAPRRLDQSAPARIEAPAPQPNDQTEERDVTPWLRKLGYSAGEARRAALQCESIPDASLEERIRLALSCLRPPHRVEKGAARPT